MDLQCVNTHRHLHTEKKFLRGKKKKRKLQFRCENKKLRKKKQKQKERKKRKKMEKKLMMKIAVNEKALLSLVYGINLGQVKWRTNAIFLYTEYHNRYDDICIGEVGSASIYKYFFASQMYKLKYMIHIIKTTSIFHLLFTTIFYTRRFCFFFLHIHCLI